MHECLTGGKHKIWQAKSCIIRAVSVFGRMCEPDPWHEATPDMAAFLKTLPP
jgi:hypothetical protein